MIRNIFSKEKDGKDKTSRKNKLKESDKKDIPVRSNSCETFKQIK